jgi:large subunit ribosomal protein L6
MSRVGKKPISIPAGVNLTLKDEILTVQGGKGSLERTIHPLISLDIKGNEALVKPAVDDRKGRALQGLFRSLVANMVTGVDKGFERVLEIEGIGYKAELKGSSLVLNIGYSHPVEFDLPEGVSAVLDKNNVIRLSAIDKELLGRTAAAIRRFRPPEPYKGKGIRYSGEYIKRKAGKTGTK